MHHRLGRGKGWSATEIFLIEKRLKVRILGISQTQAGLLPSLRASFSRGRRELERSIMTEGHGNATYFRETRKQSVK